MEAPSTEFRHRRLARYAKVVVPICAAIVLLRFTPALGLLVFVGFVVWFVVAHVHGRARVILWLFCAGLAVFVVWVGYVWQASDEGAAPKCGDIGILLGPSWSGGGQASSGSIITAAAVGVVLWLGSGVMLWRHPRRSARVIAGFLSVYLVSLVALWYVSPDVWGPRYC